MKLFIIRHGQDTCNEEGVLNGHYNSCLTPKGVEQLFNLGDQIEDKPSVIYTSPLDRCYVSANIIRTFLPLETHQVVDTDLIERNFGCFTRTPIKNLLDLYKTLGTNWFWADGIPYILDGLKVETFPNCYNRAARVVDAVKSRHADEDVNVYLVTHGDIGKMIRAYIKDLTWLQGLYLPMHNAHFERLI